MKKSILVTTLIASTLTMQAQQESNGWVSLFDGKTLNGWKKVAGDAEYRIEDGAIAGITVPNTPNTFIITEKEYGDFVLELEVKIMDTTSNSGVQFRSQYDAAGNKGKGKVFGYQYELDPSSRKWTAGVYDEGRRDWLYPLMLNPSAQSMLKTGVFNKIKVECIGNNIKTWINGKPAAYVVDNVDSKGVIALQVHSIGKPEMAGKKIFWKNIRIKTNDLKPSPFPSSVYVMNTIPNTLSDDEKKAGWKLLFDGVSNKGWKGAYKKGFPEKGWAIRDGELSVLPATGAESGNGGDIVTEEEFSAFDLSFDFPLTAVANSVV